MTYREEYKQKMSKKGTGFLEFYLWIFCPLLAIYHIYNIICYATGKQEFGTKGFLYSLIIALLAIIIVATGIFLDKLTFWFDISLPIIFILSHIENIILEIGVLAGFKSESPSPVSVMWNGLVGFTGGLLILSNAIALIILAAFLFYFVDHRDIYGY